MAIKESKKKIHFVPFEQARGAMASNTPAPTVSVKKGVLFFSQKLIEELQLNGKFVRLFYDPLKKIIGFQIREQILQTEMKTWKLVRQNKQIKIWKISIRKMLAEIGPQCVEKKYSRLPVKKYISTEPMSRGEVYYFFEIIDEVDKAEHHGTE